MYSRREEIIGKPLDICTLLTCDTEMSTIANKRRNSTSPEECKSKSLRNITKTSPGDSNNGSLVCCVHNCVILLIKKMGKKLSIVRVVAIVSYTI